MLRVLYVFWMQVLCQKYDLQNFSRLDRAEERISDLEDVSRESLKTEKQREQRLKGKKKKQNKIPKDCGTATKDETYMGTSEGQEREKETRNT